MKAGEVNVEFQVKKCKYCRVEKKARFAEIREENKIDDWDEHCGAHLFRERREENPQVDIEMRTIGTNIAGRISFKLSWFLRVQIIPALSTMSCTVLQ